MNAELINIARLTAEEATAAVELLREGDLTLEEMVGVAGTMAAGPAQLALALIEMQACEGLTARDRHGIDTDHLWAP